MITYKIRNKTTGLFSAGGTWIRWKKVGKSWTRIGDLTSHLAHFRKYSGSQHPYKDAEIVTFELVEQNTTTIAQWDADAKERSAARERKEEQYRATIREQQRKAQLEQILKQFPELQRKDTNGQEGGSGS